MILTIFILAYVLLFLWFIQFVSKEFGEIWRIVWEDEKENEHDE